MYPITILLCIMTYDVLYNTIFQLQRLTPLRKWIILTLTVPNIAYQLTFMRDVQITRV